MTSSSINNIRFVGRGATIDHLGKELNSAQFETRRGPRCFAVSTTALEYVNVIVPVATSAISALAAILIAKAKYGKIKVKYREGPVAEVTANNTKEVEEILKTAKEIHLD